MSKRERKYPKKRLGRHKAELVPHGKLLLPEEPDVSCILKVPGTEQTEESDDLFDHPLHSTAVSDYEEDGAGEDQYSEPDGATSNSSNSDTEEGNTIGSKNGHALKSRVERKLSEEEPVKNNMRTLESTSSMEDCELPSVLPLRSSSSECRISHRMKDFVKKLNADEVPRGSATSCERQEETSSETEDNCSDDPHLIQVWVPKGLKKVGRQITESDVILDEFGKITAKYRQGVESKICRKAIDNFYAGFKDQLIEAITDARELKHAKLQNAKLVRTTNKKRKRLIEVKEELIRTEPQLKKLERECAELKGKISSLRNAVQLVTDLNDLQQKYANERKENPEEKVVYGISSLPALLMESQRILAAEHHFQNINGKLQQALDLQKKK
ncbi:hypothetical protein JRQ81_016529 [Phrynocephalus forsythii]|uniref:Centromere protein U n=1 Tax=Phrynocephalus forsythii TaxID=171643 RepID=A0A9Q0XSF1_9SAUR|nr:hypothetical protein JRQ81_016529 [Phrynocephalus forsythii]